MKTETPNKKGSTNAQISMLIGSVILVAMIVALAPSWFSGFTGNLTASGAPSWVGTTGVIIISAGVVLTLWKGFGHN